MPIIVAVSAPAVATAAPVSSSSCTEPDSEARIDHLSAPIYTEAMKDRHKAGIVDVDVELLPNGAIAKAVVVKSSGDELLDAATYEAAISTTYVPAVRGCTYLAGSYIFRARYRVAPSAAKPVPIVAGPPAFAPIPVKSFGPVPYAPGALEAAASPAPTSSPSPAPSPTHH